VLGRPLTPLLPYGLRIEPLGEDFLVSEPPDRSFAGRLILPFVCDDGLAMFDLDVPSSGNFTHEDLNALWLAGRELASWRSRRALATTSDAFATPTVAGQAPVLADWHALELCARDADLLLRNWPTKIGRHLRWVPVGVGGGFEDLAHTEREIGRYGYFAVSSTGSPTPTRSARWFGQSEPVTLGAVSVMAERVSSLVATTTGETDRQMVDELVRPIHEVSALAASPAGSSDADPSSWPPAFLRFVTSCMQVLADLEARTRGEEAVPLLDTDELYEAWLAIRVRESISQRLGTMSAPQDGAIASWVDDAITYDLRVKPSFRRSTQLGAHRYKAVVAAELVPDIVLSATRGDITEFSVLDAKAWSRMMPEDVLSECAKYLYGLRRIGSDRLPSIASVSLVSCSPSPGLPDASEVKVGFVHATPTIGEDSLRSAIEQILADLAEAIERREQEASLFI